MDKIYDEWHFHQRRNSPRTEFNLQVYQNLGERPVFVVSPSPSGPNIPPQVIREAAPDLAQAYHLPAHEVQWIERRQDGSFHKHAFQSDPQEHRPVARDLSRQDYTEAEQAGLLKPSETTRFTSRKVEAITKEAARALVGKEQSLDPPTSFEQRQREAFNRMTGPKEFQKHTL